MLTVSNFSTSAQCPIWSFFQNWLRSLYLRNSIIILHLMACMNVFNLRTKCTTKDHKWHLTFTGRGIMCSYYYLTYQRDLIRLILLCYFHVRRTHLAAKELFCSGFIIICPAIVSRGDWLWKLANFKGPTYCFDFDVEPYHHVTLTLHRIPNQRSRMTVIF